MFIRLTFEKTLVNSFSDTGVWEPFVLCNGTFGWRLYFLFPVGAIPFPESCLKGFGDNLSSGSMSSEG